MRVLNYLECETILERSGIQTATAQQRRALRALEGNIDVVTTPGSEIRRRLEGGKSYDIAHCNGIGPGSLAVAQHARRTGRPLILHAHVTREDFEGSFRGSTPAGPFLESYLRRFYSQADLVCCPSEYTRGCLTSYPIEAPIEPITNGVDIDSLEGYDQFREPYRRQYGLEGMVVFAVGNVFGRKGLSTFCRLAEQTPYDFVWFGPYDRGPQASRVVKRWTGNPPANVTFTGWVEDKRAAFGAGDVFLFPTHAENQGIAVLEAMACGKAVVLRDIPVFEEFYTDGVDCLKCRTKAEFCEALESLAGDPQLRRELGARARETAREHRLEVVGDRLRELYGRVSEQ